MTVTVKRDIRGLQAESVPTYLLVAGSRYHQIGFKWRHKIEHGSTFDEMEKK